jgi:hypothetical protein
MPAKQLKGAFAPRNLFLNRERSVSLHRNPAAFGAAEQQ